MPSVVDATLTFAPARGFVERYQVSIFASGSRSNLQNFTLFDTDIGLDGLFHVLFNSTSLIPGRGYTVTVTSHIDVLTEEFLTRTTLGKCSC